MKKIFVGLALALSLTACGQADKENSAKLQSEVDKLQQEISSLRAELDAERNGPSRLFAKAKNEISELSLSSAKQSLSDLIARFPESQFAQDAKPLLIDVNAKIDAAEKAKQLELAKAAEEQRLAIARIDANLKKNTDDIEGITWISHKSEPVISNYMSLYFGTKDGSASAYPLRMKFHYFADSWLFIKNVTIKADDKVYSLQRMDFERDNAGGSIWEWSDTKVDDMEMIQKIIASKKVVIRFDGRQYYNDFVMPQSQKNAMKEIVLAWQRYGGKS